MTALCSGKICTIFPEKGALNFWKACTIALEYSEAVKQNNYTNEVKKIFINLVERYDSCILGCTELPILYEKYCNEIQCENIYDPLRMGLIKLRKEFENE